MLWEIEIHPASHLPDREADRVRGQCHPLCVRSIHDARSARSFLTEGDLTAAQIEKIASGFLADTVVETCESHLLSDGRHSNPKSEIASPKSLLNVLFKPGVTDNVADSVK